MLHAVYKLNYRRLNCFSLILSHKRMMSTLEEDMFDRDHNPREILHNRDQTPVLNKTGWRCIPCGNVNHSSSSMCTNCSKKRVTIGKESVLICTLNKSNVTHAKDLDTLETTPESLRRKWFADWTCICGFINFSARTNCKKCNALKTGASGIGSNKHKLDISEPQIEELYKVELDLKDYWTCTYCYAVNSKFITVCALCKIK